MNPDEPLRTKNLSEEEPASMDDTLGGYPWLPRMIDKARASRAGTLGGYFKYPCPIDRQCLGLLGIDSGAFADLSEHAETGTLVLDGLGVLGALNADAASFDPVALNTELHGSS
jgi:Domain of unknown function (DUF5069)